jgi:hypothetical protein
MTKLNYLYSATALLVTFCCALHAQPSTTSLANTTSGALTKCASHSADNCYEWKAGAVLPQQGFIEQHASDVLTKPYISGDVIYVGINTRWSLQGLTGKNPLLRCTTSGASPSCEVVATFPNPEVPTMRLVDGATLVVQRTTYPDTALNIGKEDFLRSTDAGKTWQSFNLPFNCTTRGWWCETRLVADNNYIVIGSKIADTTGMPIKGKGNNTSIYQSRDHGKNWGMVTSGLEQISSLATIDLFKGDALVAQGASILTSAIISISPDGEVKTLIDTEPFGAELWIITHSEKRVYLLGRRSEDKPERNNVIYALDSGKLTKLWENAETARTLCVDNDVVVAGTYDTNTLVPSTREFKSDYHVSLNGGATWVTYSVPAQLLNSISTCDAHRVYLMTPFQIFTLALKR